MLMKSLALGGLATVANAHMLMSNPVPYGRSQLDNSPLKPDGSDFPCKSRGAVFDPEGASNVYQQGSTHQLVFKGTAVHGGGSCQVSVTTDLKPNKNSVWRVIKSIEGGCPAKQQAGNMGSNPGSEDPYKYDFTVPSELSAGNYTLAWTWFNRIGNPEMYMNCAPLTVTGSGGAQGYLNSLPNMFVANIGNSCKTAQESKNLRFPNPGKNVDNFDAGQGFQPAIGDGCQKPAGGSNGGSGDGGDGGNYPTKSADNGGAYPTKSAENGGGAYPTKSTEDGASSPTTSADNGGSYPTPDASTPAEAPPAEDGSASDSSEPNDNSKSIPGGVFMTVSSGTPPASQTTAPAPAPSGSNSSQPAAPSATPSPGDGSGGKPSGGHPKGTACTTEGSWNCIGGTSFQRCASGTWSDVQGLAAGISCSPGESSDLQMKDKTARRATRRGVRFDA